MPNITSLKIKNLRGIRTGALDGLTDVNLLIGRNNCGKTTVCEALCLPRYEYTVPHDLLGREVVNEWKALRGDTSEWSRHYKQAESNQVFVHLHSALGSVYWGTDRGRIAKLQLDGVHIKTSGALERSAVFRPSDGFMSRIEQKFWPELLKSRSDRIIRDAANTIFGLEAEAFQLLPQGGLMALLPDRGLALDAFGDGTRVAMRALIFLAMLKETFFIMEEPECHQHPGSLERFARAMCGMAKGNDVQLFITTHSLECVRAFMAGAAEAKAEAAVFHLSLNDGEQTARRLDAAAFADLDASGIDVRFADLYA